MGHKINVYLITNCHTAFEKSCAILHTFGWSTKVPIIPNPCQFLVLSDFLTLDFLVNVWRHLIVVQQAFTWWLIVLRPFSPAICISSFVKGLLKSNVNLQLFIIELWKPFVYSGYKSFVKYLYYEYFSQSRASLLSCFSFWWSPIYLFFFCILWLVLSISYWINFYLPKVHEDVCLLSSRSIILVFIFKFMIRLRLTFLFKVEICLHMQRCFCFSYEYPIIPE